MKYLLFALYAIIAIVAVNYYAEVNRVILLFAVYPSCVFAGLGLCALFED